MKTINVLVLCMIIAVVSFLGFVVENVWLAITKGYIDNRNMCFPFLLGYGVAIMLFFLFFGTPDKLWFLGKSFRLKSRRIKRIIYFLIAIVLVSVGEILLGTLVEKVCEFSWWDYTRLPLHITKYTSVPTSVMFGTLITVFMGCFFEPLFNFFKEWNYSTLQYTAAMLMSLMLWDFIHSAYKMYKSKGLVVRWKIDVSNNYVYKRLNA